MTRLPVKPRRVSLMGGALAGLLLFAVSPELRAAGFFAGYRGVQTTARGGAFVAKADDLSALIYNPAGLAQINGTELLAANRFSYGVYDYTRAPTLDTSYGALAGDTAPLTPFESQKSRDFRALDPMLLLGSNFGLRDWGFALGAFAMPGRLPTDFGNAAGSRYAVLKNETVLLAFSLAAAHRFTENFGVGLTLQALSLSRQRYSLVVNANPFPGVASPVSDPLDMQVTLEAKDLFTPQLILGLWGRPRPEIELGVSAQVLPTELSAQGKLRVQPVSAPNQEIVLFRGEDVQNAAATAANDVTLRIPLPLVARMGARYVERVQGREVWDLEFDAHYETWSRVQQMTLETRGLRAKFLGAGFNVPDLVLEKHWRDTFTFALGGGWHVLPERLQLMGGGYFETALASPSYSTADTETGAHLGAGLGARLQLGALELGAGFEYRRQLPVRVSEQSGRVYQHSPNSACQPPYTDVSRCAASTLGTPGPVVNAGVYQAALFGLTLGASYHF